MAERRTLTEGLQQTPEVDPEIERAFVFKKKTSRNADEAAREIVARSPSPTLASPRSPISTRIRADYAEALKRASLERQLAKTEPNTISDILEAALEPWLKSNNHLY